MREQPVEPRSRVAGHLDTDSGSAVECRGEKGGSTSARRDAASGKGAELAMAIRICIPIWLKTAAT